MFLLLTNIFSWEVIVEKNRLNRYKDQIWATRVSRINAEKRLIECKELIYIIRVLLLFFQYTH